MKTKVTINGVEYNLDLEKAQELGVLEKENKRCKSWEEFFNKYFNGYGYRKETRISCPIYTEDQLTQDDALALAAFSKLLKLRRDWIGEWNPDISESMICIEVTSDLEEFVVSRVWKFPRTFSFPTEKMAEEFLHYFRSLFKRCKILI